jgi:hypothetical protein
MMRAALIVVGLGTLVAMELDAPPRNTKPVNTKAVDEPLAQSTVGLSASRDTLTKADLLDIPYVQYEAPVQPISPVERMPPPAPTAVVPQESPPQKAPKIIDQHGRSARAKKVAVMLPKPRPEHTASRKTAMKTAKITEKKTGNKTANTERSKVITEVKSCRPNAFDSLLKALNLSPRCET